MGGEENGGSTYGAMAVEKMAVAERACAMDEAASSSRTILMHQNITRGDRRRPLDPGAPSRTAAKQGVRNSNLSKNHSSKESVE